MLLLRVIVALSVYQHYCVGKYIFSVDYDVGFEIDAEDLELIDDEFTADSDESQIKDDEFTADSYEILITDDEFTADFYEIIITDDEFTEDSYENYITDDEFTAYSDENKITDDELTKVSYENDITDDEFTANSDENKITDDEFTANSDENKITDDEFTTKPDENTTADDELTTKPDENSTTDNELTTKPDENSTTDDELTTKPDENSTTDNELTTKPDENPTTESGECPPEKSRVSKNDIRRLVDYIFNAHGLNKSMIERIVPEAKDINQKHSEDFNQFLNWFKNEPDHLKDVLQGLAAVKKRIIEPEAQKMADILKDYPQLEENIDKKKLVFNKLSKDLKRYEIICKYQCEDQEPEPSHIFKRSIAEEYLCISLEDLGEQVKTGLKENFDGFINKIKDNLRNTDKTFTETIKSIKDELNGGALKEFGLTMYNVLNLQKDHHSFVNEINSTNTAGLIYAVKEGELQIGSKLLELEKLIKNYRVYCHNCNKGPVKRSVRQTKLVKNENENSKVSIVHELIEEKYNKSENVLNEIIEETFKDLNELINDPTRRETYLNNLKLREKEIIEVANKVRRNLEHLKSIASPETIKKLSDLDSVSNDMLKNIDEKITHLKKIIK